MRRKINSLLILLVLTISYITIVIEIAPPVSAYTSRDPISIDGNSDFANQAAFENWTGNGTPDNPYIIEGYEINASDEFSLNPNPIDIRSTDVHFIIRNSSISGDWYNSNINLFEVSNASIENCIIKNGSYGIEISRGSNNKVINNSLIDNDILLWETINSTFYQNKFVNSGLIIEGNKLRFWNTHNIDISNTINGKPIYYFKDENEGFVHEDAGGVIMVNCSNMVIKDLELDKSSTGIILAYSSHNTIKNNVINSQTMGGISLWHSSENELSHNSISSSTQGIIFEHSDNNTIQYNDLKSNSDGIILIHSNNNYVDKNNASFGTGTGIYCGSPSGHFPTYGNIITNNNVSNNGFEGIDIEHSQGFSVYGNNISDNWIGISLGLTNESLFHHNILIGNSIQLKREESSNVWHNVSNVGNFWSDYTGSDADKDGIGDTDLPHNGVDYYPLMDPDGPEYQKNDNTDDQDSEESNISETYFLILILIILIIIIFVVMLVKKKSKNNGSESDDEDED